MENENDIEVFAVPNSPFVFSGISPDSDSFGASKYALVTLTCDRSGSTWRYIKQITEALNLAVRSCKLSPMAENIRLRALDFNSTLHEIHGFIELSNVPEYKDLRSEDETALVDAVYSSISSGVAYAQKLRANEYSVNMLNIIITDGYENASVYDAKKLKDYIESVKDSEQAGSILTILIGVNDQGSLQGELEKFKTEVGIDKYISLGQLDEKSLALLMEIISKSVSSSSQAIVNGKPQDPASFGF